jgi:hypothetical protein
VENPA